MDKTVKSWYRRYRKEPYWIDNWREPKNRLIVREGNGNMVARNAYVKKDRKPKRTWKLKDYCKYCTDFLIEQTGEDAEDPCVRCGIRDALRQEQLRDLTSEVTPQTTTRGETYD